MVDDGEVTAAEIGIGMGWCRVFLWRGWWRATYDEGAEAVAAMMTEEGRREDMGRELDRKGRREGLDWEVMGEREEEEEDEGVEEEVVEDGEEVVEG
jgi:hypothetical protein